MLHVHVWIINKQLVCYQQISQESEGSVNLAESVRTQVVQVCSKESGESTKKKKNNYKV